MTQRLLVADIGGTKSEIALAEEAGGRVELLFRRRYENRGADGVAALLQRFLGEEGLPWHPVRGCLALAGVVEGGQARFTNLDWEVSAPQLCGQLGLEQILLVNDLTALAASLPLLTGDGVRILQQGIAHTGTRGVIAPGTGLGEGMLIAEGPLQLARGSEGGHCDFAPVDAVQRALLDWVVRAGGRQRVCYEDLIAGPGFAALFDFCRSYYSLEPLPRVRTLLESGAVVAAAVVAGLREEAAGDACPLCRKVIDLFLAILGSEAGNLALKLYARGGIYLGGGILPRLEGLVSYDGFLAAFHAKGHMTGLMRDIPVRLILQDDAPLRGAAAYGLQHRPPGQSGNGSGNG